MSNRKQDRDEPQARSPRDPGSYGDGRNPVVKHPTLFPSEKAIQLGNRGEAAALAFFSNMRHSLIETDIASLGSELAYVADVYIREARFRELPTTEEYRSYATRVGRAARTLLKELNAGRDKSWGLNQGTRRTLKFSLWNKPDDPQRSLESTLLAFVNICDEFVTIEAPTASRPREDIRIVVDRLAVMWERLTGCRCPTNLTRNKDKGDSDFEAEGPRFVHAVAQAFDPSITPQQIATALRKRRARRPRLQPSQPD